MRRRAESGRMVELSSTKMGLDTRRGSVLRFSLSCTVADVLILQTGTYDELVSMRLTTIPRQGSSGGPIVDVDTGVYPVSSRLNSSDLPPLCRCRRRCHSWLGP